MEGSSVVRELHVVSGQQESCIFSPFCGFLSVSFERLARGRVTFTAQWWAGSLDSITG